MNKAFRHTIKYVLALLMIMSMSLVLAGCGASEWKYDPITDVNDLEGRRVGVNLAWESDYYLTGRQDMKLSRYDTTSDMIMALKYDKIDVIALSIYAMAQLLPTNLNSDFILVEFFPTVNNRKHRISQAAQDASFSPRQI
jgi:ABC-type amino acid transport substrate-binding protein